MIGRLQMVVLDAAEPEALAAFWSQVLGWPETRRDGRWVEISDGTQTLAFQHAPDHVPPRWPDPAHPQQLHLDVEVGDVDVAEAAVLALGARSLDHEEPGFRVYADPAGHPFCLVW
jgi:catechol 2,3-dioxygenase-like lactoylglutathione lyase family enzyme